MPLSTRTFVPQLRSARLFGIQTNEMANQTARLASGERLLRANDNAAGIAISETIRTRVISYNAAGRNARDAQDMLQTAEGGLDETAKILQRMRELILRGANDSLTDMDKAKIADELRGLSIDIDLISERTHYNGKKLLAGGDASQGFTFVVDADAIHNINVKIATASAAALGVLSTQLSVDTAANASITLTKLDAAIEKVANTRSQIGSHIEELSHAVASLGVTSNAASESQSIIRELDTARESSRLARNKIMSESSRAMFTQANQTAMQVLKLLQ